MSTKQRLTQALGGALVFATFGCAWGAYGMYSLGRTDEPWLLGIPLVITLILIVTLMKLQRRVEALPSEPATPEMEQREARGRKVFTIVNIVQAIAIFLAVQVWFNLHKPEYLAPTIAVIVGLHFFALAGPMQLPSHRIPGALLLLLALVTMIAVPSHQMWAVVIGLGNALILWGCYALRLREVLSALIQSGRLG
jgi:MFS family permease